MTPYELCCITSLWLSDAPAPSARLEQISAWYFSIISCCGFGIKGSIPISKVEEQQEADFKCSLFHVLCKSFLSFELLQKKNNFLYIQINKYI